jgi:hypothetical protein
MKANKIPTTYCHGFNIKITEDVRKSDYIKMCEAISEGINNLNNSNIKMQPEAISEGGMVMTGLDNKEWYKTMRHATYKWEWINDDTYDKWKSSDEILWNAGTKSKYASHQPSTVTTYLKAFHGAPVWTLEELNIIKEVFEEYGFKVTKMPKKTHLVEYWDKFP